MKKVITLLLVAVMLVACMAVTSFAAEAGDTVEIAFTVSNPGAAVFGAQINYDSTALELVSISRGDLTSGGMFSGTASTGKVAYLGETNITGTGSVFVAQFKVLDTAEAGKTYQITATVDASTTADADGNLVNFAINGGSITIDKPVCEHVWNEGEVTKEATCTEDGVMTYTCTVAGCGETKTEVIPATGHNFGEWKVTKAATCTEKGEETRECACGEKETREIPVVEHALNSYGKDATHHWLLCDNCDHAGEKEPHAYDYNGICVCGATKPVEDDPNLDDVPQTGDITPYIAMAFVPFVALAAVVIFDQKRKAVK